MTVRPSSNSNHEILARYGSDEWTSIYLDRWEALYQAVNKHNVQLVIVGLPIMKSARFDTKLQSVSQEVLHGQNNTIVPIIPIRSLTTNGDGAYQQYLTIEDKPLKFRLKDGVHLSYQGSKIISKHIFGRLQETFQWAVDENSTEAHQECTHLLIYPVPRGCSNIRYNTPRSVTIMQLHVSYGKIGRFRLESPITSF